MLIIIIIVAILWLFANKPPAQSSGSQPGTTIVSSNPPSWTQTPIGTGPSREPTLISWFDSLLTGVGVPPPNAFTATATGQAQSSSIEIQNSQLTDFTTVPVPPTPGGGSSTTPPATGGGGGGSSIGGGAGATTGGGRGSQTFFSGGSSGPQPLGAGPGVNSPVNAPLNFASPTGPLSTAGQTPQPTGVQPKPIVPRVRIATVK